MLSLDLETYPIERARLAPKPVCVSWAPGPSVALYKDVYDRLWAWLESDVTIVGTHICFDMAVIGEATPGLLPVIFSKYERDQIQSVDLNQKLIDIASRGRTEDSNSLETLCGRYDLPSPDKSGPWRLEFAALDGIPVDRWPAGAREYVLADAARPLQIAQAQHAYDREWQDRSGGRGPILHLAGYEARKAFALHLISCWGIMTDRAKTKALRARLERYMRHAGHWLERSRLVRPDKTRDTKEAKARMIATCEVAGRPVPRTDTGRVALNKDACADYGDGLLRLYSEYSQSATLMARVEDFEQGHDLPLQSSFDSLLETGRTSSYKPAPPLVGQQAQNMPRKVGARECLVPRPGRVFISADLPNAELRSLSQFNIDLQGRSIMAEKLNAGEDLHQWFGDVIGGTRQDAKPCNFGFPGGLGPDTFMVFAWGMYRRRFTRDQCVRYKHLWLVAFPEMPGFFQYINRQIGSRSHALVRHHRSGRWRNRVPYCAACNTQFQELTATAAADGLCEAQRRAYTAKASALYGCRTVLYTHDELVMEAPIDQAHDAALELSQVMAWRFNFWHPDVRVLGCTGPGGGPKTVAPVVSSVYSKKMEAVWENGRLVPWGQ